MQMCSTSSNTRATRVPPVLPDARKCPPFERMVSAGIFVECIQHLFAPATADDDWGASQN